ncbi:MAG: glycosyltransferase family 4 protein [Thermoanaerobaculia bacterium]|nr:glycosyltransferase family 4 protein [Thermoanaerobaculia bacterium]
MRIGVDILKALPPRDGIGNYTYHLLRALAETDGENEYVLFGLPGDLDRSVVQSRLPQLPENFRIAPTRYPAPGEVDLFHATGLWYPVGHRGSCVATCHDLTFLDHSDLHLVANRLQALTATAQAVLGGARFHCVSRFSADRLHHLLGVEEERITVVPHGVSPVFAPRRRDEARARLHQRFGVDGPFILSVGTLEPRKNHRRLIEAWWNLRSTHAREVALVLAGPPGWKTEGLFEDPGAMPGLHRLGWVTEDELVDLYAAALVFAFPSISEGFGMPVLEAMACGAPVLTSTAGSLPEVAGSAALLVDPTSSREIGDGLARLISEPELRAHLVELGWQRAAGFSWYTTAAAIRSLYSLPPFASPPTDILDGDPEYLAELQKPMSGPSQSGDSQAAGPRRSEGLGVLAARIYHGRWSRSLRGAAVNVLGHARYRHWRQRIPLYAARDRRHWSSRVDYLEGLVECGRSSGSLSAGTIDLFRCQVADLRALGRFDEAS